MGIRVGYEPVGSIGGLALQSGRNSYEKWLADQRLRQQQLALQQQEMLQRQQMQAMQLAAQKESQASQQEYNWKVNQQENDWRQQHAANALDWQRENAQAERDFKSAEDKAQRDWLAQQNQQKVDMANQAVSDQLGGLSAAFGGNPLDSSQQVEPEQQQAYTESMKIANALGGIAPYGSINDFGQLQAQDDDSTAAFKKQYTPSQRRELANIYSSKDRIERDDSLRAGEKLDALKKLLDRRDAILKNPVPVLPDKSNFEIRDLDGGAKLILNHATGQATIYQPKPVADPAEETKKENQKQLEARMKEYRKYYLGMKDGNEPRYTPSQAEQMARWDTQGMTPNELADTGKEIAQGLEGVYGPIYDVGKNVAQGLVPGMASSPVEPQGEQLRMQQLSQIKMQMIDAAKRNDVKEVERLRAIGKQLAGAK